MPAYEQLAVSYILPAELTGVRIVNTGVTETASIIVTVIFGSDVYESAFVPDNTHYIVDSESFVPDFYPLSTK